MLRWQVTPLLSERSLSSLLDNTIHPMIAKVLSPSDGGPTEHTSDSFTESIPFASTRHQVTALSSTEAEFSAAVAATKVVTDFQSILNAIPLPSSGPTIIYVDNTSCFKVFKTLIFLPSAHDALILLVFRIQDWQRQ